MSVRWTCETCGSVKLGPKRPKKDDVCRYCFKCSEKRGRLVERKALALEAKREARKARSVARKKRQSAREMARSFDHRRVSGINLDMELARFWCLPTIKEARAIPSGTPPFQTTRSGPGFPTLIIRRSKTKKHTSGRAWTNRRRIVLTIGTPEDVSDVLVTLLHEVAHCALPPGESHGPLFWETFAHAAAEAWPGLWGGHVEVPVSGDKYQKHTFIWHAVQRLLAVKKGA